MNETPIRKRKKSPSNWHSAEQLPTAERTEYSRIMRLAFPEKYSRTSEQNQIFNKRARDKKSVEQKQAEHKKYYIRNRDSILAYHAKPETKARVNEYRKKKYRTDPQWRIRQRLGARVSDCIRNKTASTMELLGCSMGRFMEYIQAHFQPGMTWSNYGLRGWHIDHKRPCASFDLTNPDHQRECFHWLNLQPMWAHDNISKSDKYTP